MIAALAMLVGIAAGWWIVEAERDRRFVRAMEDTYGQIHIVNVTAPTIAELHVEVR